MDKKEKNRKRRFIQSFENQKGINFPFGLSASFFLSPFQSLATFSYQTLAI